MKWFIQLLNDLSLIFSLKVMPNGNIEVDKNRKHFGRRKSDD